MGPDRLIVVGVLAATLGGSACGGEDRAPGDTAGDDSRPTEDASTRVNDSTGNQGEGAAPGDALYFPDLIDAGVATDAVLDCTQHYDCVQGQYCYQVHLLTETLASAVANETARSADLD